VPAQGHEARQAQKAGAVGQLTGGNAHDPNDLPAGTIGRPKAIVTTKPFVVAVLASKIGKVVEG
jgi:hypothetical protein